jgi:hypothetical protein
MGFETRPGAGKPSEVPDPLQTRIQGNRAGADIREAGAGDERDESAESAIPPRGGPRRTPTAC